MLQVNLCHKLFFLQKTCRTCCVQKNVLNVRNNFCTQHVLSRFELGSFMYWTCNSTNNLSSYCRLVDEKITASDKDLPVLKPNEFNGCQTHLPDLWKQRNIFLWKLQLLLEIFWSYKCCRSLDLWRQPPRSEKHNRMNSYLEEKFCLYHKIDFILLTKSAF